MCILAMCCCSQSVTPKLFVQWRKPSPHNKTHPDHFTLNIPVRKILYSTHDTAWEVCHALLCLRAAVEWRIEERWKDSRANVWMTPLFFCLFVCLVSWLVFGSQSCSEGEDEVLSLQRNQILIGFCSSHNVLKHWNWAESAEDWSGFPGALANALHLHNQALKW